MTNRQSIDEELSSALRSRDAEGLAALLPRLPGEALGELILRAEEDIDWLTSLRDAVIKAAPLCACGEIATTKDDAYCPRHARAEWDYRDARLAWLREKTDATARAMMRAAFVAGIEKKPGVCAFPPCGKETGMDYDAHYLWCDEHNRVFDNFGKKDEPVEQLPNLRKARGEENDRGGWRPDARRSQMARWRRVEKLEPP